MPQIIVTADDAHEQERDGVMLRERVNADDFESERFAANLIERLGWHPPVHGRCRYDDQRPEMWRQLACT